MVIAKTLNLILLCKSQPADDKPCLILRGQIMLPINNFWGS